MTDYINGTSRKGNVVERVNTVNTVKTVEKVEQAPQQDIDLAKFANTVAQAVISNLPTQHSARSGIMLDDDQNVFEFDDSRTLEKLADNMIVQRGDKETNFKELGNVETTEKDQKEVNKTIDLLRGLDD
tara:strand:+ start:71998 stop:72384 length:387 start_codon:yes stop_codon:yes gene_type:complete